MTTHIRTIEEQYHKSEKLLNDFKNQRITYTEAIDTIAEWLKASREEGYREGYKDGENNKYPLLKLENPLREGKPGI